MWLPTPIYERVPQFWFLLGLLFMTSGTYLGFEYSLSFVYFGVGFICVIWAVCVFVMRSRSRKHPVLNLTQRLEQEKLQASAEQPTEQPTEQPG